MVKFVSDRTNDRHRILNEVCRRVLQDFVGRDLTPYLVAEAEATLRAALDNAVRAGSYVLPDGLALDRIELGPDMRIKVFFCYVLTTSASPGAAGEHGLDAALADVEPAGDPAVPEPGVV